MFLFRMLFWLVALPFRMVFWLLGLAVWGVTLPLRLVLGTLGFIGYGRILQIGLMAGASYFFYRLVNPEEEALPDGAAPANALDDGGTTATSKDALDRNPTT